MYGREVVWGVAGDEITGLFFPPNKVPDPAIYARINDLPQTLTLLLGFLNDCQIQCLGGLTFELVISKG